MYEPCGKCHTGEGRYEHEVNGRRLWLCTLCWQAEEHRADRDRRLEDLTRGHTDTH